MESKKQHLDLLEAELESATVARIRAYCALWRNSPEELHAELLADFEAASEAERLAEVAFWKALP
jgi:hypothetical protein